MSCKNEWPECICAEIFLTKKKKKCQFSFCVGCVAQSHHHFHLGCSMRYVSYLMWNNLKLWLSTHCFFTATHTHRQANAHTHTASSQTLWMHLPVPFHSIACIIIIITILWVFVLLTTSASARSCLQDILHIFASECLRACTQQCSDFEPAVVTK